MKRWWLLRGTQTWVQDKANLNYLIGGQELRTTEQWVQGRRWLRFWERVR